MEIKKYGTDNFGSVAIPHLMLYIHKWRFHDTKYHIRKDGDLFKIGDPP